MGNLRKSLLTLIVEKQNRLFNFLEMPEALPLASRLSKFGGYGGSQSSGKRPSKQQPLESFGSVLNNSVPHLRQLLFQYQSMVLPWFTLGRIRQLEEYANLRMRDPSGLETFAMAKTVTLTMQQTVMFLFYRCTGYLSWHGRWCK